MSWTWTILLVLNYVLAVIATLGVLTRPREPRAMLAWILALLLLPGIGLLCFMLIGEPRLERTRRRRRRRRQHLALSLSRQVAALEEHHALAKVEQVNPAVRPLMQVAARISGSQPTHSNLVTLYHHEEGTFQALCAALAAARSHIHMEYYIFRADEAGCTIRDLLVERARKGVLCRLLLDYVGSWPLSRGFLRSLTAAGVEVAFSRPVAPWQGRCRINFRNHRKLTLVDGRYALTGSHNIGNEYRGQHPTLGCWQDSNVALRGPAVQQLQEVFVEDWANSTGVELVSDSYFPPPEPVGPHIVQVISSGPDMDINPMHDVIFAGIGAARESIAIMTPYFVPDAAMLQALQSAAQRGVKVQLVIPSRNDNTLALWAGRSFYQELAAAGAEIREFPLGMLHNKVMVVDGWWSLLGSANMDHRSFRINFELCTALYDPGLAAELLADFERFRRQSRRVARRGRAPWSFGQSVAIGAARLVSPLL